MGEYEFVVSEGPTKGQTCAFPGPRFFIGSGAECQVRFDSSLVQPKHAEVMLDQQGTPWLRDLTGAGLVWINGENTKQGMLALGSFVRLGRVELVVREKGRMGSGTMATPTPLRQQQSVSASGRVKGVAPAASPRSTSSMRGTGQQAPAAGEIPLDATAKRPTPFAATAAKPQSAVLDALNNPDDGLQPSDDRTVASSMLPPGTVIDGRYNIIGKLAAGGMGEVYKAEHVELGKPMALKVMLPELSRDQEFVDRFKREAIAASRIGQQNIVDISDFGRTQGGRFYFVMEFLDGLTLASVVHRQGALPIERAVNITLQTARALAAAHAQSIVHRDLKPENVMLLQRPGQPDFVKVLDFGVAKVSTGQGKGGHTAVGMVVGTPQYMSPEQAKAIPVDARSDIYSLGLILYELVTGRPTFTGETPSILMVKHVTEAPPPFAPGPLAEVPLELEQLVFRMLEKEPDARPQTMEEVVHTLDSIWARLKTNDPSLKRVSGEFRAAATPAQPGVAVRVSGGYKGVATSGVRSGLGQQQPVEAPMPEELQLRRSPTPYVIGALLLVGLGGGVGYAALSTTKEEPKPVVIVQQPPKEDPKPVVKDPPKEVVVPKGKLSITTLPEKAEVYEGDVLVGTTPLVLERETDKLAELKFVLKGYKAETKKVSFANSTSITLELEKEKKSGGFTPKKGGNDLADDPYKQEDDLKESPF